MHCILICFRHKLPIAGAYVTRENESELYTPAGVFTSLQVTHCVGFSADENGEVVAGEDTQVENWLGVGKVWFFFKKRNLHFSFVEKALEQYEDVITLLLPKPAGESSPWTVPCGGNLAPAVFLSWRAQEI